jgi:ornithine cyclodeaminase/alanine dehydrogenase-like protein (mu-crystallin family)
VDALGGTLVGLDAAATRLGARRDVLVLGSRELSAVIPIGVVIDAVERAYRLAGERALAQVPRVPVRDPGTRTFLHVLPAVSGSAGAAGAHIYTAGNRGAGVPQKVTLLYDTVDGGLRAIVESDWLSWARTGATGAVATKALALPDASRLGIIGSGRQARAQAVAIAASRELSQILVYSPDVEHCTRFADEIAVRTGVATEVLASADAVVEASDIVSTATTAHDPVFGGEVLRAGTHVNAIGAHYPDRRELDVTTIGRARLFVDDPARSDIEDGELRLARSDGVASESLHVASLADVVAGSATGRTDDSDVTVFLSGGLASEYLLAVAAVVERAEALGIGKRVAL